MPGVVFDFDGVVCDSEPLHERALRAAAESDGMGFTTETFREHFIGMGEVGCFRALAELHGRVLSGPEIAELSRRKVEAFGAVIDAEPPVPNRGACELIRAAAEAGAVALCSGSRRGEVVPILERLGVLGLFGAVVTADDVDEPKPDPAGYRLACARIGIAPGEAVALEDSPPGLIAARAAGLATAAVCHSYPRDRLDADHIVERIDQLSIEVLLALATNGGRSA